MESGIYIRVGKEDKLLERMTEEERTEWLKGLSDEALIRTVNIVCERLKSLQDVVWNYELYN